MKKILLVLLTSIMTYAQAGNVAKAPIASPTFTGTVTIPTLNITSAFKIGGTTVTPSVTELNYVDGVTSPIQTQFTNITDSTAALRTDINSNTASITNFISGEGFIVSTGSQTVNPTLDYNGTLDLQGAVVQIKSTNGLTSTNTNELFFDAEQGTESLYLHTGSEDYYFPSMKIVTAELKKIDFIPFSDNYPQLNDYQGLRWGFDMQIDSVVCSIQSTGATGTMAFNIWHGSVYSPSVGENYVFSSTQTITQENTETPNTFKTGWSTRNVDAGSFLWVQYSTMTGTIEKFFITVYYTRL